MINEKWLRISVFIPIWGTIINAFILFILYIKNRSFRLIKLFGGVALSGIIFAVFAFLFAQVIKYMFMQFANIDLESYIILIIAFVLAGIAMNVMFVFYYRKTFVEKTDEKELKQ